MGIPSGDNLTSKRERKSSASGVLDEKNRRSATRNIIAPLGTDRAGYSNLLIEMKPPLNPVAGYLSLVFSEHLNPSLMILI